MPNLAVWYSRRTAASIRDQFGDRVNARQRRQFDKRTARAQTKDSTRALTRLTRDVDGEPRIAGNPPLIVPIEDLLPGADGDRMQEGIRDLLRDYRAGAAARPPARARGLPLRPPRPQGRGRRQRRHARVDRAPARARRRGPAVPAGQGGGPVGARGHSGATWRGNQGRRVVEGQRLMQAASDIFLGWLRVDRARRAPRDFYVRQLWDWKVSAEVEAMAPDAAPGLRRAVRWTLARAHARSGDRIAIAAYLGSGDPSTGARGLRRGLRRPERA